MQKIIKPGNSRLYVLVGAMAVVAGAWHTGEAIKKRLASLPIQEVPRVDRSSKAINARSFYPVWVKQTVAVANTASPQGPGQGGEFENLFTDKEDPKLKPAAPTEPDHATLFKQQARVDGVAKDGAFINGRFYKVGQPMAELGVAGVVPVIESVTPGAVNFRVGTAKISFKTGGG